MLTTAMQLKGMRHRTFVGACSLALLLSAPLAVGAQQPKKYTRADVEADQKLLDEVKDVMIGKMKRPPDMKWPPVVELIEDADLNAYALFDRKDPQLPRVHFHIRWLREIVQGDADVLAITMGHELGHVHHGHARNFHDKAKFANYAMKRAQETEADEFGALLLLQCGYSLDKAIAGDTRLVNFNKRHFSKLDALESTHPAWIDRWARMAKEPKFWHAMSAYANGVSFLTNEHHALAAACFERVIKEFPACYEAWHNRGYAYLMLYYDGLTLEDVEDYGVGQVVCGGFYQRIKSLQPPTRGKDRTNWNEAVVSLRQALKLKPDLALAKANLGLAYLFHPDGKDLKEALAHLEDAARGLDKDELADPVARAATHINLAAAYLAAGREQEGFAELGKGVRRAATGPLLDQPRLESAADYHRAMAKAQKNDPAAPREIEHYLRNSYAPGIWWRAAHKRYELACKNAGIAPKDKKSLLVPSPSVLRPRLSLDLPTGDKITLAEPTADVVKRLGPVRETKVVGKTLTRLNFPKHNIDVLATNEVIAIVLASPGAPPLPMLARDAGGEKRFDLKLGMSRREVLDNLGQTLVGRKLFDTGDEYHYYRQLGLAIRYDQPHPDGHVAEIVLARVPDES